MATVGAPQPQPPPLDPPNPGGGGEPPDRPILPKETPNDQIPPEYKRCRGCSLVKHNQHFIRASGAKRPGLAVNCGTCRGLSTSGDRSTIRELLLGLPLMPSSKRAPDVLSSPEGRASRAASTAYGPIRRPSGSPPPQPAQQPPGLRARASLGFGSLRFSGRGRALTPILPRGQSPAPALGNPQPRSGFQRLTSIFHRRGQVEGYTPEQQAPHDDRLNIQRRHRSERRQGQVTSATPPSQELLARLPLVGGDPFVEHNRQMCPRCWQYFPEAEFQGRGQCPACYSDLRSSQSASQSTTSLQSDYMMSDPSTPRPTPRRQRGPALGSQYRPRGSQYPAAEAAGP
ncbi:hypothetical protein B0T24DRAFT_207273 [Lasiosphaeria ovina]|uniref:Uncharacterized protein n=1 Tax=Lasiosphaeria ovina TaxID=92902 RepID=A0AAE0NA90_9PEZI|nr:hypothetical protein B0T24DRAFT_207273 [Lasiosphaeria ovina]